MKKEEQTLQSLQGDIDFLKRQVAGLKGHNKVLKKLQEDAEKEIARLKDALNVAEESRGNLREELRRVKVLLNDYKSIVEWYDELPWWRKIFTWKLLPKKKE
jgi:chromosome segregation ATPase